MDEGEWQGWKGRLGQIMEGSNTSLWPLLSSKDTTLLKVLFSFSPPRAALNLFLQLPQGLHPQLSAAPIVVCRPPICVLQAFFPGQSGHQFPIRGWTLLSPSQLSLQSLESPCPGMDCVEKASFFAYHLPNPCLAHCPAGKS